MSAKSRPISVSAVKENSAKAPLAQLLLNFQFKALDALDRQNFRLQGIQGKGAATRRNQLLDG